MRATQLLVQQLNSADTILRDLAGDLTPAELTARALPHTNVLGFDLWHVARTRDWALRTLVLGEPEQIDDARWQGRGRLVTHGIGVGLSEAQADELARGLALGDILEYASATHAALISWLDSIPEEELGRVVDVEPHLARYPVYLEPAMRAEVPWMFQRPPVWRCLAPALGHVRDHLAQAALLKTQLRG